MLSPQISHPVTRVEDVFQIVDKKIVAVVAELQTIRGGPRLSSTIRRGPHIEFDCSIPGRFGDLRGCRYSNHICLTGACFDRRSEAKHNVCPSKWLTSASHLGQTSARLQIVWIGWQLVVVV